MECFKASVLEERLIYLWMIYWVFYYFYKFGKSKKNITE